MRGALVFQVGDLVKSLHSFHDCDEDPDDLGLIVESTESTFEYEDMEGTHKAAIPMWVILVNGRLTWWSPDNMLLVNRVGP